MRIVNLLLSILFLLASTVKADSICNLNHQKLVSWKNVVFTIPDCLVLNTEEGNSVYKYKNKAEKGFIMITGLEGLSSEIIYNNLIEYGNKLAYVKKQYININGVEVTLISYRLPPEKEPSYEAKTYIFNDLKVRLITYGTADDHALFYSVVETLKPAN